MLALVGLVVAIVALVVAIVALVVGLALAATARREDDELERLERESERARDSTPKRNAQ